LNSQWAQMQRREFITLLGGTVATWPLAARAQQRAAPVIGFLSGWFAGDSNEYLAYFRQGLAETGYIEGQNVTIEYRWAEGNYDKVAGAGRRFGSAPSDRDYDT